MNNKKIKSILLSTPEVRTILAEKNPQIRRAVKKAPTLWAYHKPFEIPAHEGNFLTNEPSGRWNYEYSNSWPIQAPYKTKDILYVREAWGIGRAGTIIYRADYPDKCAPLADGEKWKAPIRSVARLFLRINDTDVKCIDDAWFWIFDCQKLIGDVETVQKHIL